MSPVGPEGTRVRVLEAARRCFEQWGLEKTSLEDVAGAAGLSRATLYRHFPGGRDQIVSETVTWEVGNFLTRIGTAVEDQPGIAAKLESGLLVGHRAIVEHRLLHQLLSTEPERLLKELAESGLLMMGVIRGYLAAQLAGEELAEGRDPEEAAEYLARLYLSYLGSQGRWDLTDPAAVHRLVRTQFLAGVLARPPR